MSSDPRVICWGEILWDCLPKGLFLGGAPFNVAHHLGQLGIPSAIASAVGVDLLGGQAKVRAERSGVAWTFVEEVADLPTGYVTVDLDSSGNATYTIVEPVAWDRIRATRSLLQAVLHADAVLFGSLAQRGSFNREEWEKFLSAATGLRFMDVNLRAPFDLREEVLELARRADFLKLNSDELAILSGVGGGIVRQAEHLASQTGAREVCVTLGADGAMYWCPEFSAQASRPEPVEVVDTVGAGDAFMASIMKSRIEGCMGSAGEVTDALDAACFLGGRVAATRGATPQHTEFDA